MDQFCISHLSCWADMHKYNKYIHLAGATARIFDKKKKKKNGGKKGEGK